MSFMKRAATWGVVAEFSLGSYAKMLSPAYLRVFGESLWLSVLTTGFTLLLGYPFAYFTAQLSPKRRSLALLLVIVPFWTNSLVRIYGWMILLRSQGVVNARSSRSASLTRRLNSCIILGPCWSAWCMPCCPS